MPKKSINDIRVPTYDDLFTNEEQRQEAKLEKIMEVPVEDIQEFKNHPFRVRNDEQMSELVKSVSENGILVPVLIRPNKKKDGYEMVSGHRRKFAMQQTGATEIDAIIRDLENLLMTKQQSLWLIQIYKGKTFYQLKEDLLTN